MRINYSIIDALAFLKSEIERLERKMKKEKNRHYRHEIESLIEWNLERGLEMIKMAPRGTNQEVIDYFIGRKKKRPDLLKLEELMEKGLKDKE